LLAETLTRSETVSLEERRIRMIMKLFKKIYLLKAKFQHMYVTRDFYYNKLNHDYDYMQKRLLTTGFVDGYVKALEHMGIDPKDYPYGTEQCLLKSKP
jgi:hypothetical protein